MIRTTAKSLSVVAALAALFNAGPLEAATVTYLSSSGVPSAPCTPAQPCSYLQPALNNLDTSGGQVSCLDSPTIGDNSLNTTLPLSVTIDCVGTFPTSFANVGAIVLGGTGDVIKIRNLTINGRLGGYPGIRFTGSGSLVLENCVFEDLNGGAALDIEPTGPVTLTVTGGRISNGTAGVLLKPASGGSINATFDHVTISQNSGGGLKSDTTNGPVTIDLTNSVVSNNGGNGINAVGNAGGQNIVSIKNSIIARNGGAGVQANGASAGVLVATTLLDQNAGGATAIVNGGNMFTYGNNDVVGAIGAGFPNTAPLH
jgi:Right handed beta helix region